MTNSTDVDNDTLTYSYRVYSDLGLTNIVASINGIEPGNNGTTSWTVTPVLSENTFYYWQVIVIDEHGAETSSEVAEFFVNSYNDAPSKPAIIAPAIDGEITSKDLTIAVKNATDADNDPLFYRFQIDTVDTFDSASLMTSELLEEGTEETVWSVTGLDDNTNYYWRVRAIDGAAESSWTLGRFFVNTVNDAPGIPEIRNPGNSSWVDTLTPELVLFPAEDVDNDLLIYNYQIFADNELTNLLTENLSGGEQWVIDVPLPDNNWYYWRARAVDEHNMSGNWSDAYSFYVDNNGINDTPQLNFVEPAANVVTATVQTQIRWEDSDPDSNAIISLYYDTDASGQDGTLIANNLNEDADGDGDTYLWDVTLIDDGTYYLYAIISDETHTTVVYSTVSVTIDRIAPQLTVTPGGGTFVDTQNIEFSTSENAEIYYTLDGSEPTTASTHYTNAILVDQTTTLRAIAIDAAGNESSILTEVYTIETAANTPPVADAGSNITVSLGENAVTNCEASYDPDNGPLPLSFTWTIASVPPGSSITNNDLINANTTQCIFTPDAAGDYVLLLTVDDGKDQASAQVIISCQAVDVPGDLDGDGDIDFNDYYKFVSAFGKCGGQPGYDPLCDFDGDNCITFIDYQIWYGYYLNQ